MRPGETRFDHIAIGVRRMAEAPAVLVGVLGGTPRYGMDQGVYRFGQWEFEGGGRLEILEPGAQEGFLHRFLADRGPGVHHVTFRVGDLRDACDRAEARGYRVVGYNDSNPGWKEAFLHPKHALGIVVQFAESHPVPGSADPTHGWQAPPGPADPPPPVTLVGLRLRARSRERARTQWELVLHGTAEEDGAGVVAYRWPRSPLRITVEIDPRADEGPLAIEYVADRPVPLPAGPHPVLGASFVTVPGSRSAPR